MEEINRRYKLLDLAGRGGMGNVYRVKDQARDGEVIALKTLLKERLNRSRLKSFKREFKTLSKLSHPNLEEVFDYGKIESGPEEEEGSYFFTCEYLEGKSPDEGINGDQWRMVCEYMVQVCRALQFIHSHELIHYDIKPENILIVSEEEEDGPPGSSGNGKNLSEDAVKLIDFGLADDKKTAGGLSIRGTVPYIAPEIIRGEPVDGRADLYALGVTMFEIISGELPFDGETSTSVLRSHLETEPPDPAELERNIPDDLSDLILELLSKEPEARPRDANEVIGKLTDVADLPYETETKDTMKGYVSSSVFVGREEELEWLQNKLEQVDQHEQTARFALISGEAGIGKSRLLKEFQIWAQTHNYPVLTGKVQRQGSRPFGVVQELMEKFVRQVEVWESTEKLPDDYVREYVPFLQKIVPSLAERYEVEEELPSLGEEEEILRLLDKTAEFIIRATGDQAVVLILEDLQWADDMSIKFLEYLSRKIALKYEENRVLIAASRRTDLAKSEFGEPFKQLFQEGFVEENSLSPFTVWEAKKFITSMFGQAGEEIASRVIEREESGNPLFVEALLGSLVDQEVLVHTDEGWRLDQDRWEKLDPPEKVEDVISIRLESLEEKSHRFIRYLTAWGGTVSYSGLEEFFPASVQVSEDEMAELLRKGILRKEREDGLEQFRLASNRIGETVRERMEDQWRDVSQELLFRLEEGIRTSEDREKEEVELSGVRPGEGEIHQFEDHLDRLARLSWQARNGAKYLEYGRKAAERAEERYAYDQAFELYERFLELDVSEDRKVRILEKLGDLKKIRGDLKEADWYYRKALDLGDDTQLDTEFRVLSKRAEIFESAGDGDSSQKCYERALKLFEGEVQSDDPSLRKRYIETLLSYAWFCGERKSDFDRAKSLNEKAENVLEEDSALDEEDRKNLIADAARNEGMIQFRQGNFEEALSQLQDAYEVYRENQLPRGEARTAGNIGLIYRRFGEYDRAIEYFEKCVEICEELGDRMGEARASGNLGLLYRDLQDVDRALSYLKRCYRISQETGDRQGVGNAAGNIGLLYWNRRNVEEALRYYKVHLEVSEEIGYRRGEAKASANIGVVCEEKGDLEEARTYYQKSLSINKDIGEPKGEAVALVNIARIYYNRGDHSKALSNVKRAFQMCTKLEYEKGKRSALSCRADILSAQGKFEEALETCEKALTTARQMETEVAELDLMFQKGKIYLRDDRLDEACKQMEKVLSEAKSREVNKRFIAEVRVRYARAIALDTIQYGTSDPEEEKQIPGSTFVESDEWGRGDRLRERAENILKDIDFFRFQVEIDCVRSLYELPEEGPDRVERSLRNIENRLREKTFHTRAERMKSIAEYVSNLRFEEKEKEEATEDQYELPETEMEEIPSFRMMSQETQEVFELIRDLTADLDSDVLFRRILDTALNITGADLGVLAVPPEFEEGEVDLFSGGVEIDPDQLVVKLARNKEGEVSSDVDNKLPQEQLLEVFREERHFSLNGDEAGAEGDFGSDDYESYYLCPLRSEGQVLGVLFLGSQQEDDVFSEQDQFLISYLAVHAGMALRNILLHEQAVRDRLSGLYTNNYFKQRFHEEIQLATRYSRPLSLLMMDLDGFKKINDLMGHTAGDQLIEQIGSILQEKLRGYDISAMSDLVAGRYGGDEFEVLLPGAGPNDATEVAERILEGIRNADFEYEGQEMDVSVSIGIATYPEDGNTVSELIEAADEAMMKVKQKGGNRYFSFSRMEREAEEKKKEWMRYSEIGQHFISRSKMTFKSLLSDVIGADMEVDKMLEITLKMVVQAVNARSGYVVTEDSSGELRVRARFDYRDESLDSTNGTGEDSDRLSRQLVRKAMDEGKGVLVEDASENPNFERFQSVEELELRSILVVPVRAGERQIGVIYLENSVVRGRFDEEDLSLLSALAREISGPLEAAREHQEKVDELEKMKQKYRRVHGNLRTRFSYENMVGSSDAMKEVFRTLDKVIPTELNVLIEGDTGTGKELAARSIHYNSPRQENPFLAVNCARFTETLLESELFGHKQGSFTGAEDDRAGLFEQADGGTLFLDEISEMSSDMQARILRVLETGEVRRIGDDRVREVDVRIICATNQPLQQMMDEGKFREDLYYRLSDAHVRMPPLEERKEDIPELVEFFLDEIAGEEGESRKEIEDEALVELARRNWPGNVRQLRSKIRQLVMFAGDRDVIRKEDLSSEIIDERSDTGVDRSGGIRGSGSGTQKTESVQETRDEVLPLEDVEKKAIQNALSASDGNKKEAAELLGIHYTTLYRKINEFDLD